ncbi:MAG: hypothetical protein MUF87_17590 [Anaerolineae bacterium]|jgi:hypothetical protein|nr:hypothetical protein [Anaerolineae bacterium]
MRNYIYLDGDEERQQLIGQIAKVRLDVLRVVENVPADLWYTPRYHNWSLGAMLGHLNLADRLSLWLIQAALLRIRPRIPLSLVNQANDFMANVYRNRLIDASKRDMQRNEKRITTLIQHLPEDKLALGVYHPALGIETTVERALQDLYVYHWIEHLHTMQSVEGLPQTKADWV